MSPCLCIKTSCSVAFLRCLLEHFLHIVQRRLCCVSHFSLYIHLAQCCPVSFLGAASFLYSKGQVSRILGQYTIVSLLPLLLAGSVPKQLFLFVLLCRGSYFLSYMVLYHQYSTNHQHVFCSLFQSISAEASCLLSNKLMFLTDFWNCFRTCSAHLLSFVFSPNILCYSQRLQSTWGLTVLSSPRAHTACHSNYQVMKLRCSIKD